MQLSFSFLVFIVIAVFAAAQDSVPISFSYSHILSNVATSDCGGNNYDSCISAISQTVASIISVDTSSVSSVKFYDVSTSGGRILQGASQTTVAYTVNTESTTATYDSLTSTLTSAINAGTFTTTMQSFGANSPLVTADALSEANGGQLTPQNRLVSRKASSMLTGTQIAGLVIGIVLFLVLLGVLIAFSLQAKNSEATYVAANAKPVSTKEVVSYKEVELSSKETA